MPKTRAVMPSVDVGGTHRVGVTGARLRLGQVARSDEHHRDAERRVDEEADTPRQPAGEDPAGDEAHGGRDAGHGRVVGDGAGALRSFLEARLQQRQCRRREDRRADALDGARGDQPRFGLRGADGYGGPA